MRGGTAILAVLAALLAAALAAAVLALPDAAPGLGPQVLAGLERTGVAHPVTAVLLNYRGYDTMLEIAVLLAVLAGVWSLGPALVDAADGPARNPVLQTATRALIPLLLLVAGYLLWVGSSAPGGAFQAGAVLAAGGILLLLAGWRPAPGLRPLVTVGCVAGLLLFAAVAAATLLADGVVLALPPAAAGSLILAIELAATLSIGLILAALYLGGEPR